MTLIRVEGQEMDGWMTIPRMAGRASSLRVLPAQMMAAIDTIFEV